MKYVEEPVDGQSALDICAHYGASHLLYGDFETVFSSSFIRFVWIIKPYLYVMM